MATMFAPARVIPGFQDTRVEEYRIGSILVRGLDPKTVQRLKAQASVNGRSLEQEIQEILERAARMLTMREAGKPVGYSRVAAGEGHAGLPWGGRGNHEKVLRTAYAPRAG